LLATITVNTAVDGTNSSSTLSLRQAIEISNGAIAVSSLTSQQQALVSGVVSASNTIDFDIPTSDPGYDATTGVWTITVTSELPAIATNAAVIDGYSQTGAKKNTLTQADNATLKIAINGPGLQSDGLTIDQPGSAVFGLDIENFSGGVGVLINAAGNVQVAGCFIGTDPTGETAAPNGSGVKIDNSSNLVGGPLVGDRNIISGNANYGILIPPQNLNPLSILPTNNVVENNFIGIDAAGTKGLGNGLLGVQDEGSLNTFGGTSAGLGNVISGNNTGGLQSSGSVTIEGNFVGTDATGNVAIGNGSGRPGISALGDPSTATDTTVITNNVASGNSGVGIIVTVADQATSTYNISNNLIGTNAAGTAALGNGASGLQLESLENATVDDNVISANKVLGIDFSGFGQSVENNVFQGNKIGTDETGTAALPNLDGGVELTAAIGVTFGGPGSLGNVVAFNDGAGVWVAGQNPSLSEHVLVTQNSIFANTGLGIYLGINNVNNNFQMPPVLTWTPIGNGSTGTLTATLASNSAANQSYSIEIFSNPEIPAQGETYIQTLSVTADSSGKGSVSIVLPAAIYTATATELFTNPVEPGNTSQFALPPTVTALSSSQNPAPVGQQVTFTAVVTVPGSTDPATGSVTFSIDGHAQLAVNLAVVGGVDQATFSTSTLTVGPHTVVATYNGDSSHEPSTSATTTQTMTSAALTNTTTAVSSSKNPSTVGQQVTFTAVVTPSATLATPGGTVTFSIDGQPQTPATLTDVGGVYEAQFTTSSLTAGGHSVSAAYSGDSNFNASSGMLPTQTVNLATLADTTTTVSSSMNPSPLGEIVTFTAVVSPSGSSGSPTGSVTFTIDGKALPAAGLSVVGGQDQAQVATTTLSLGPHTISAAYSGDASFNPSTGHLPTQTITTALVATVTTPSSSLNPSTFGQPLTFTAVVTAPSSQGTPTGTVTFTIDGQVQSPLPLAIVAGSDQAQFTTSSLTVGEHSVSATYSGDSTFATSAGDLTTLTVDAAPLVATSTTLMTSPNPSTFGQHVEFVATVFAADNSPVGGTVTFLDGTNVLGEGTIGTNGVATFDDPSLPVGSSAITASYSGDSQHSPSVSSPVAQVVTASSVVSPSVVLLQRFGYHMQPTSLVLSFNTALDAVSAQNVQDYRIVTVGGRGRGGKFAGRSIAIRKAIYNPSSLTVTLVPAQRLDIHNTYRLTVDGTDPTGVHGATGLPLDGGNQGSNYEALITWRTLAGPAPGFATKAVKRAAAAVKPTDRPTKAGVDALAAANEIGTVALNSGSKLAKR
jgi:hypothetical protein